MVKVTYIIIGVFLGFVLSEMTLRAVRLDYGNSPVNSHPVLHHVHPKNYTFLVHTPSGEYGGHRVTYDATGYRISESGNHDTPSKFRVAFLGDSFVEAMQVSYYDSFVGQLQKKACPNVAIKNFGVTSYSPVLQNIQWDIDVSHFNPTHIFLLTYFNDIEDDIEYFKLGGSPRDDLPNVIPGPREGGVRSFLRKLFTMRLIRKFWLQLAYMLEHDQSLPGSERVGEGYINPNPEITSLTSRAILSLRNKADQKGVSFTLMAVPSKWRLLNKDGYNADRPEYSDAWKRWAQSNNVEFLDLVPSFRSNIGYKEKLFFENDAHFTKFGHGVVSEVISNKFPKLFNSSCP